MAEKGDAAGFMAGFVVGALIGAAAALLFAPQSGEATRSQIRDRSIELQERADALGTEARKRAVEVSAQTKEKAAGLQAKMKQAVEEGKGAAADKKQELLSGLEESGVDPGDEASTPA